MTILGPIVLFWLLTLAEINYLMTPIIQADGYNAVRLREDQKLVAGIPNKVEGWHQQWWWFERA